MQQDRLLKESEENTDRLLKKFDQFTEEANAWVTALTTLCEIITTQLKQKVEEVKHETAVLQAKYDKREECIHALVLKHRQKLNRKVEETIADGWKQWLAQVAELQVLRADAKNRKKEGRGFYKMDDTSIQMICEGLTKDFHALADVHTKAIRKLLEELNDNQMLLMLDTERAMNANSPD